MPAPYLPNSDVILCTVLDCDWDYVEPTAVDLRDTFPEMFGTHLLPERVLTARARRIEDEVKKHMATHAALDFLKTIQKLIQDRSEAIHLLDAAVPLLPPAVDSDTVLRRRIAAFVDRVRAEGIGAVIDPPRGGTS